MRGAAAILAVVVAWAAAAAAACFDFDATQRGGPLVDGGTDAGGGGADAADATVVTDSSAGDGAPEASGGPFCATYPSHGSVFFCDDFDGDGGLPGSWSTFHQTSGTLSETDASWVSPPNSIDLALGALTASQPVDVALRTPLQMPSPFSTLVFAFSVEPMSVDTSAGAAIVLGAVDFLDAANGRYSLELAIQMQSGAALMALGEQSGLADGGAQYVNHPLSAPALQMHTFTGVTLNVDWTTAKARVDVNGVQGSDVTLTPTVQPASFQIGIGTSYAAEPSPGWELRYDNVVFTAM
jgi:hypothetical protein